MPHTFINGFGGTVTFAAYTLDVESWTLNQSGEAVDTTNTGDAGWESNILGAKSWEGSCKTFFDTSSVPTGADGLIGGAAGTATFNVGSSGKSYTGSIRITQIAIENPVKGVVGFSLNFKGNGPLTFAS